MYVCVGGGGGGGFRPLKQETFTDKSFSDLYFDQTEFPS